MRTTVNLDSDVYTFAQAYAGGRGITLSAAIGELIRRAERMPSEPPSPALRTSPHGYLIIAGTGGQITPETVKQHSE